MLERDSSFNDKMPFERKHTLQLQPLNFPALPDRPLVSVLMPNYNYGRYIAKAIESVLSQTYPDFELIICDDGSQDESLDIIRTYAEKDNRIVSITKENGGMASALNRAYAKSQGHVVCFLDSDDEFLPTKLESVVTAFKRNSECGMIVHAMEIRDADGRYVSSIPIFTPFEKGFLAPKLYRRGGRWRYMPASAICLRREVAEQLFPIDEQLFRSVADAYVFTLGPILASVDFIDRILTIYRLHGSNITGAGDITVNGIERTLKNIERVMEGVNKKLKELGLPSLCINNNLNYKEQKLFLELLSCQATWVLLHNVHRISVDILNDDLYTPLQKLGALFMFWTSLLIPCSYRGMYIRMFTHPNKFKSFVKYILKTARSILHGRTR
ncbi:glycosyltransferase [Thermus sediminis]|uniref:glycosyltransferase n=1 Tax=Thermus sediminis TaxID=1761908 RepID=UPI000E3DA984|nr:glycosyltransferase [Thermus sediminis]